MTSLLRDVAKDSRRSANLCDEQVHRAVAVNVSRAQSPADIRLAAEGRIVRRNISKLTLPLIHENLIAVLIVGPEGFRRRIAALDKPVHEGHIERPILIEVGQYGPPGSPVPLALRKSRANRELLEHSRRFMEPQPMMFIGEMSDEKIGQSIAVDVPIGHSHIRCRCAAGVEGQPASGGFFFELAVLLIDPKVIGRHIVGHENVGPLVAGQVSAENAHSGT